jgi:hypothetical protein
MWIRGMHCVPHQLKLMDEPLYAPRREGIKGYSRKTTEMGDFLF